MGEADAVLLQQLIQHSKNLNITTKWIKYHLVNYLSSMASVVPIPQKYTDGGRFSHSAHSLLPAENEHYT